MDLEAKFRAVVTDAEALYRRIEVAIGAHTGGTLNPQHLEDVRDACDGLIKNASAGLGEAVGNPVPPGPPVSETAAQTTGSTETSDATDSDD